MKRLLLCLCLTCLTNNLWAQELCANGVDDDGDSLIDLYDPDCACSGILTGVTSLIPNPSFEDTLCCPTGFSQLNDCAASWIQASEATSDYFNTCGYASVPGFPPPFPLPGGGSGYVGFLNYPGYQEMVGACLMSPMKADTSYRLSFFLAKGSSIAPPLVIAIYGTPDCHDLPWEGIGCPIGIGSWVLMGQDSITFADTSWYRISIQFTPSQDIRALAIGGSCSGIPAGYIENAYYIDELMLASIAQLDYNIHVEELGKWCTNDLQLRASIDVTGGSWQWYRSGIALPGEANNTLNVMPYGTGAVYTVVYSLDGDCVSIDHTVEPVFFQGLIPELTVTPACKDLSNGQAYLVTDTVDTFAFTYQWRSLEDTTILSDSDTLNHVSAGSYTLQIKRGSHCDTLLYFDIPEENLSVSFLPSDTLICTLDTLQFINTSDTHFTAYHWTFDNGDTFSGTNPPPYSFPERGAYPVRLIGTGLICMDTAYGTIQVDQPILPGFESEPKAVCVGQPIYFYPRTDSTTVQLTWDMTGLLHTESVVQEYYQHGFISEGTFSVTLQIESRACPDTSYTDSITIYPLPEVDLGADSSICLHGQPVYLKNLREAPLSPYHQVWSTGDTIAILKVVHPGIYTLSVSTEPIGCTTTETITIGKDCYIDTKCVYPRRGRA